MQIWRIGPDQPWMFHGKSWTFFWGSKILQSGAPVYDSVQLVQITPVTMVYGTYNYSIHGVYKPSNITGGPHIVRNGKALLPQTR